MPRVNVSLIFEAKNAADAQKQIESWGLPEGIKVSASMIPQSVGPVGAVVDAKGKLVEPPPPEEEP